MKTVLYFSLFSLLACQPNSSVSIDLGPNLAENTPSDNGAQSDDGIQSDLDETQLRSNIKMIPIPTGGFEMGIAQGDEDWDAGHEPHWVELTNEFSISKTEVTLGQWIAYMGYNPHEIHDAPQPDCLNCPVHSISWHEIAAYSNTMSEIHNYDNCFDCEGEGIDVTCQVAINAYECNGFRLPTEAEWEFAAKGGEDHIYPGSETINDIGWWEENSDMLAYHVGQKKPNGYGLYDMGGNIREYVYDWYAVYGATEQVNPVVTPTQGAWPAERGGSYACRRPELRVDRRNLVSGYDRDAHSGFRLVRILD